MPCSNPPEKYYSEASLQPELDHFEACLEALKSLDDSAEALSEHMAVFDWLAFVVVAAASGDWKM